MSFSSIMSGISQFGSAFGPISSAVGGVLSSIFGHSDMKKNMDLQIAENQKDRDFNAEQARLNREFQVQMFDKENEYNDPRNVVSRLQSAGINPAVAFSGIADSASAPNGNMASSQNGLTPSSANYSGLISGPSQLSDIQLKQAQARKLNADAGKLEAETPWVDRLNSLFAEGSELDNQLKGLLPKSEKLRQNLDEKRAENLVESTRNLKKTWDKIDSEIGFINAQKMELDIVLKYADERQRAEIDSILSSAAEKLSTVRLNEKQIWQIGRLTPALANLKWAEGESLLYANLENERNEETLRRFYNEHKNELAGLKWDTLQATLQALQRQGEGAAIDWLDSLGKAVGLGAGIYMGLRSRGYSGQRNYGRTSPWEGPAYFE